VVKKIISTEDSNLFRQTVGKVTKIDSDKVLPVEHTKPKPYPRKKTINPAKNLIETSLDNVLEKVSIEDDLSYLSPGLQHKVLKKLREGFFGSAAELDLHGLSSNEAKKQLLNFLQFCIEDGYRCAHIIHGKGYRSSENHPVLKNNINLWLRQHTQVLAFCSAQAKHGGTGAVFVLLQQAGKLNR